MERQQGVKHNGVLTAIKEAKLGDLDTIRKLKMEREKRSVVLLRLDAPPSHCHLRERLDEGKSLLLAAILF